MAEALVRAAALEPGEAARAAAEPYSLAARRLARRGARGAAASAVAVGRIR